MTQLPAYHEFGGADPEISAVRHVLAYQGWRVPHTQAAPSEALLFGISGGLVALYFIFEHPGYDPQFHFVTRNTFDPFDKLLDRLKIARQTKHTDDPAKAQAALSAALAAGQPAIVWGDIYQFASTNVPPADDNWMSAPFVVYGLTDNHALLAGRTQTGLQVTQDELRRARGRIATLKHRMMTLGLPDDSQLIPAIRAGISECLRHFTAEAPLKPLRGKFGLEAYTYWARLLTDGKDKQGWPKKLADPQRWLAALTSFYHYTQALYTGGAAARPQYAAFLGEAARLLDQPALNEAAVAWQSAGAVWLALYDVLLPAANAPLAGLRATIDEDAQLDRTQGAASLPARQALTQQQAAYRAQAIEHYRTHPGQMAEHNAALRDAVLRLHAAEAQAVTALQAAWGPVT